MPKVTIINRSTLTKTIRPALDAKLAELSEELGIQITSGRGTYGDTTGSFKVELATITEDGQVMTPEREAFLRFHELYDLPKEALDAVVEIGGHKVKIAGIKTKAHKNNVVLDSTDGSDRQMVAPASTVKAVYRLQHVHSEKAG
ncbi:hypothetical protein [Marinobacter salicampi]|uniref:hypothetical protein n=1 Tax=Marinobacter salicampi TaxID=435907 RepID=UPI0014091BAD|nr:hypothetical protein [Marinobacter salicampi]